MADEQQQPSQQTQPPQTPPQPQGTQGGTPETPPEQKDIPGTEREFKPNIYPVIYWAIAYGAIAGVVLFIFSILARYITIVWFPVVLAGVIWGGFRNYQKQKHQWSTNKNIPPVKQSAMDEFKEAVRDITSASKEMLRQQEAEQPQAEEQSQQPPQDTTQQPPQL